MMTKYKSLLFGVIALVTGMLAGCGGGDNTGSSICSGSNLNCLRDDLLGVWTGTYDDNGTERQVLAQFADNRNSFLFINGLGLVTGQWLPGNTNSVDADEVPLSGEFYTDGSSGSAVNLVMDVGNTSLSADASGALTGDFELVRDTTTTNIVRNQASLIGTRVDTNPTELTSAGLPVGVNWQLTFDNDGDLVFSNALSTVADCLIAGTIVEADDSESNNEFVQDDGVDIELIGCNPTSQNTDFTNAIGHFTSTGNILRLVLYNNADSVERAVFLELVPAT